MAISLSGKSVISSSLIIHSAMRDLCLDNNKREELHFVDSRIVIGHNNLKKRLSKNGKD